MVHYNGHALDDNSARLEGAIFFPNFPKAFWDPQGSLFCALLGRSELLTRAQTAVRARGHKEQNLRRSLQRNRFCVFCQVAKRDSPRGRQFLCFRSTFLGSPCAQRGFFVGKVVLKSFHAAVAVRLGAFTRIILMMIFFCRVKRPGRGYPRNYV